MSLLRPFPVEFRLTDRGGEPHPVLDDLFESVELAQITALAWLVHQGLIDPAFPAELQEQLMTQFVGLERRTPSGDWRTLR